MPLVLCHYGVELAVDVFPLAHAADIDKILAQQLFILAIAQLVRALPAACIVDPLPQL